MMRRWLTLVLVPCLLLVAGSTALPEQIGTPGEAGTDGEHDELDEEIFGPSDKAIIELIHLTKGGGLRTRAEAIWKLARLNDERGAKPIADLIGDPDQALRPFVAIGLGWLGDKAFDHVSRLIPFLGSSSDFTRATAIWALGRMCNVTVRPKLEPFKKSEIELEKFLAFEALSNLSTDGVFLGPLRRPLKGSTLLVISAGDAASASYVFQELGAEERVKFESVTVGPFNPSMSKLGGMSGSQQSKFSELLQFRDGQPQVDAVFITPVYGHELSMKLRWELWNYVRRGGKLVTVDTPFLTFLDTHTTTRHHQIDLRFEWFQSIFDALLPESIGPSDLPFLDGTSSKSRSFRYGFTRYGRGAVLVMGSPGAESVKVPDLYNVRQKTWRHLIFGAYVGTDHADDPVLWRQMFRWLLEGPEAFPASVALAGLPSLRAGAEAKLPLHVRNYLHREPEFEATVELRSKEGRELARSSVAFRAPKGTTKTAAAFLAVPLEAWECDYSIRLKLMDRGGKSVCTTRSAVKVSPAFAIKIVAPAEFPPSGGPLPMKARVASRLGQKTGPLQVVASIADHRARQLVRSLESAEFSPEQQREFDFRFSAQDFPAGLYSWTLDVKRDGRLLARSTAPLVKMEPWRFRKELVVAPFGFGPLQPETEIEAHRALGLSTYGLPPSFGMWTYLIHSPTFLPRRGWPAEILEGPEGDEWRELGTETRQNPFFTFVDSVEEADLQIGSNLTMYGDVEEAGHEQYRIYLKRKYRTLSALNQAWGSDYLSWDEIDLLGGVVGKDGEVIYTSQIGMTTGQLVTAPEAPGATREFSTLQPYHDQNAWRWHYIWHLLEIRHAAFHQADPYHPLAPGGAMGLHAPFDVPHFRTYAWNGLSDFSRRATFSRPAYGTKPHTLLIGVPNDPRALSKLCWQGLAGGARFLMPYAPGDQYGVALLTKGYEPLPIGEAFRDILRQIKSKQEVLLGTHNAVETRGLFLSEGDSGYGSTLTPALYEALLWSGILTDYGPGLENRKFVITGSRGLSAPTIRALRAFVEGGGTLLVLPRASGELLKEFGLECVEQELPEDFLKRVAFEGAALPGLPECKIRSRYRAGLTVRSGKWAPVGKYEDGVPAVLSGSFGKGRAFVLNFDPPDAKLADLYRMGEARTEREAYREVIASLAALAGLPGVFQTMDRDGSVVPYVEVQPLETEDGTQKYLIAYSDHRLPEGAASASGRIQVKLPGVKQVQDVYAGKTLPLPDGRFGFEFEPGGGTVFSLITEELAAVEIEPETREFGPGAPLRLRVEVKRADGRLSGCEHAFNIHVLDSTGAEIRGLHQRCSLKGRGLVNLYPSWSDPDGEWRIVAHDLTAGLKAETVVKKSNEAPTPPVAASEPFRDPRPDICLTAASPLSLDGFGNFVDLDAVVRNETGQPLQLKVKLRIPPECLLAGQQEQTVTVGARAGERLTWHLFISRENAVGFHYSDKTSGFFTDHFRPEVHRYRGKPMPAIEIETLDGRPATFQAEGTEISQPVSAFSYRVPVRLNPFELAPARIGNDESEPVALTIRNHSRRSVTGRARVQRHENWSEVPATHPFSVDGTASTTVTFTPRLRQAATMDPGVHEVPVFFEIQGKALPGRKLRVEHVRQRTWLVREGDRAAAMQGRLPFEPDEDFTGRAWKRITTASRVELGHLLPKVGSHAYAACYVLSPEDRDATVQVRPTGANVRAWLNGALAYSSERKPKGDKETETPALDGEEETDDFLKEVAPGLRKGKNYLLLEVSRTAKRYRDPVVSLLDKNGKRIRNLIYLADPERE